MNRTKKHKLQYVAQLVVYAGLAGGVLWAFGGTPITYALLIGLLLLPGRIHGWLLRDLYTGRRLLQAGRYEESISTLQRFVEMTVDRPMVRRLWWLQSAIYTRDPVAMALNNIGAANLELGRLDEARVSLDAALSLDELYPLPHYNLALLAQLEENDDVRDGHLARAEALGFSKTAVDTLIMRAGSILARVEGKAPRQ